MDAYSLFLGAALGIVGAFGTGFLKKAGEDLYSLLKAKINPKSLHSISPQVVVHLHDDRGDTQVESAPPTEFSPSAIECVSQLSFDDIEKAIDSAPPMQRKHVANRYLGLKVEWDTYLRSANEQDNGEVFLRLAIDKDYQGRVVFCKVLAEQYRVLGILPRGAHIRVAGEVTKADSCDIELSNVRLQISQNLTAS